ncbi:MAG: protein kinase [Planctomycetes bacterium]|nr:protein kinase [Planctomycetota bacterium]
MRIGRYRLKRQLGRGGMGAVYLAEDEHLGRTVAVKVLATELSKSRTYVERFHREARAAARLNHPHIVSAIDVGQDGFRHYFVMEYIDGEMLRRRLNVRGPLSESEALDVCEKVAMALEHASAHGIIHRDIKPENIMIDRDGLVKLLDMGLAKDLRDTNTSLTQAGTLIGTPLYASPEQLRGEPDVDARTDIYSLGITLYHMLVGRPPFDGENVAVITLKHLTEEVPSPRLDRPEISEDTARLVWRMTRPRRDDRYQAASDLLVDIRRVMRGERIAGPSTTLEGGRRLQRRKGTHRRPRLRHLAVGLAVIAIAAALLILAWLFSRPPPAARPTATTTTARMGVTSSAPLPASTVSPLEDERPGTAPTPPAALDTESAPTPPVAPGQLPPRPPLDAGTENLGRLTGLEFKPPDDRVIFEDRPEFNLEERLTAEAWVKVRTFDSLGTIVQKASADSRWGDQSYGLTVGMDQRIYFMASGEDEWFRLGSRPLKPGVLIHIAATFDEGKVRLFINGEQHEERNWSLRRLQPSREGPLVLGNTASKKRQAFDGRIYQVRISSTTRYLENFKPSRRLEKDEESVLVTWMEEGSGQAVRAWLGGGEAQPWSGRITGAQWITDPWRP